MKRASKRARASARALAAGMFDRVTRTIVEVGIRTVFEIITKDLPQETPTPIEQLVGKFADALDVPTVEALRKILTPAQAAIAADLWLLDSQKRKDRAAETTNGVST